MRLVWLLLLLASLAPAPASAQSEPLDSATASHLRAFITELQRAVHQNDSLAVARLVSYPLRVNAPRSIRWVRTRTQFIGRYSRIFTPVVRAAIAAQDPDSVFHNWQGFMIGDGEVWFQDRCPGAPTCTVHFAISAVNLDSLSR